MDPAEQPYMNGAATGPQFDLARAHAHFWRERGDEIDVLRIYARTLRPWWKSILLSMLLVSGITGVVSKFYLAKWYKANAVLRPVSQAAVQGQLLGLMGAFGSSNGTGISGLLGNSGGSDADEYVGILKSFNFTRALVRHHDLLSIFLPLQNTSTAEFDSSRHLQWLVYRKMKSRFTCEYEIKTGNVALDYEDTDPAQAQMVLAYIVDDLRELVRNKQIREAKGAVASLKDEARRSSDPMIEAALYQLIATQIQREKMAEVQADFAFTIIEPSVASDIKVWPPTMLLCLLAAFATFAIAASYILFVRSNGTRALREDERTAQDPDNEAHNGLDSERQPSHL
jgi:hypothetical protein